MKSNKIMSFLDEYQWQIARICLYLFFILTTTAACPVHLAGFAAAYFLCAQAESAIFAYAKILGLSYP